MKSFFSKNINRAIVFICIAAMLFVACNHIFKFKNGERTNLIMDEFYDLEQDSVECIFFGSSVTQRAYITPVAYHEYGVPAYLVATGSQPFVLTKYLMEETLKTQKPKLFVVELKGVCKDVDRLRDSAVRKVVDNMKPSLNKFRAIRAITKYAKNGKNKVDTTGLTYYFPVIKYHSLWNLSKHPHTIEAIDYYTGYVPNADLTFRPIERHMIPYNQNEFLVELKMTEALIDLLDYCDTLEDTKVLFAIPPYESTNEGMGKLNFAINIIEERGYECLNCLPEEKRLEIGLDDRTCYYNKEHLDYYGALKYTDYFFKYIMENYDIKDIRGEAGHDVWEKEYERLMSDLDGKYSDKYNEMMQYIKTIEAEGE